MSLSRITTAAALVAGLGSIAAVSVAQAQTRHVQPAASDFYAVRDGGAPTYEGHVNAYRGAPVPASVSHTVMGLSTPY